ncbi:MAG: rod-binding protein [Campylobacter sp.]|nr:rod-binding protein [Campylobacter sp.]
MIDNTMALNAYSNLATSRLLQAANSKDENVRAKFQAEQDVKLREQTDAFESFMVKSFLDIALKESDKNTLFPKSAGSDIYKSMYNDTMSRALSGNLGFSDLLYNFLKQRA